MSRLQNENAHSALSVSELNSKIKGIFDSEPALTDVWVKGEISNFKNHSTGHFYFSLKDEESLIRSVMFRSSASRLAFVPENGMKVIAHGRVTSFVRDGQYQLYADAMEPDGVGALYIAYEQLKKRLEAEGLFDASRKRQIPKIPARIGIITSPTGAAIRDMINVTGRRFPYAKIILYPSLVQGPAAPHSLIEGVRYFNRTHSADVLIIGRGGGSIEDLWAFNDETLAREVARSEIPVISAVGHETDFTICDFVADRRAPTPSAAAELAVPETGELKMKFDNVVKFESRLISQKITSLRERLRYLSSTRHLSDPKLLIDDRRMAVLFASERIVSSERARVADAKLSLGRVAAKLEALNPLSVISRGYSAVYDGERHLIKSVSQLNIGDCVTFRTADGSADANVVALHPNSETGSSK